LNLLVTLVGTLFVFVLMKIHVLKFSGRSLVIVALVINLSFRFFVLIPMQYYSPAGELRVMRNTLQVVPRVPGQVVSVHVKSHDKVEIGAPLLSIDPRAYAEEVKRLEGALADAETRAGLLEEQMLSAEANLESSRQKLTIATAQFKSTSEELLLGAIAATKSARAASLNADRELERMQQLLDSKAVSAQEFDQALERQAVALNNLRAAESSEAAAQIAVTTGENQIEAARQAVYLSESAVRQAKLNYDAKSNGENPLVVQARALLEEAKLKLEWTTVTAPISGTVAGVNILPGQQVGSGPVMILQDSSDTKFYVALEQSIVRHVRVGDSAEMFLDLFPGQHFPAKVESIGEGVAEGQLMPTGDLASSADLQKRSPFIVRLVPDDPELAQSLPTGAGGAGSVFTENFKLTRVPRKVIGRMLSWLKFVMP
jgi:multidrug resistance efflux pump